MWATNESALGILDNLDNFGSPNDDITRNTKKSSRTDDSTVLNYYINPRNGEKIYFNTDDGNNSDDEIFTPREKYPKPFRGMGRGRYLNKDVSLQLQIKGSLGVGKVPQRNNNVSMECDRNVKDSSDDEDVIELNDPPVVKKEVVRKKRGTNVLMDRLLSVVDNRLELADPEPDSLPMKKTPAINQSKADVSSKNSNSGNLTSDFPSSRASPFKQQGSRTPVNEFTNSFIENFHNPDIKFTEIITTNNHYQRKQQPQQQLYKHPNSEERTTKKVLNLDPIKFVSKNPTNTAHNNYLIKKSEEKSVFKEDMYRPRTIPNNRNFDSGRRYERNLFTKEDFPPLS